MICDQDPLRHRPGGINGQVKTTGEVCLDGGKLCQHGLPNVVSPPKSGHWRAAEGMEFPWRWNVDTMAMDLKIIWEMSDETSTRFRQGR